MIYFLLVALALGFVRAEKSAILELTGDAPTVHFGKLGGSDVLTLVHSPAEEKLTCSGTLEATDVRIAGTSTTVADLIGEVATLRQEMAAVKDRDDATAGFASARFATVGPFFVPITITLSAALHITLSAALQITLSLHITLSAALHITLSAALHITLSAAFHITLSAALDSASISFTNITIAVASATFATATITLLTTAS